MVIVIVIVLVSNKIVSLHQGKLSVASEGLGHGATFYIDLPASEDSRLSFQEGLLRVASLVSSGHQPSTTNSISNRVKSLTSFSNSVHAENELAGSQDEQSLIGHTFISNSQIITQCSLTRSNSHTIVCDQSTKKLIRSPPTARQALSVLLVNTSGIDRRQFSRQLQTRIQYRAEADSGDHACRIVEMSLAPRIESTSSFDVIFVEDETPDMSGLVTITALRKLGFSGLIIGTTNNSDIAHRTRILASGADHVLVRPFDINTVWAMIGT
jgi:CheY-like chemotaxis protein